MKCKNAGGSVAGRTLLWSGDCLRNITGLESNSSLQRMLYSKANKMLGLISRTIKYRHKSILLHLYKSLVRPHLDYCSSVWNPYYSKDKELSLLERVQHRFTRLFPELRKLPYDERLQQLSLWSLEERRN